LYSSSFSITTALRYESKLPNLLLDMLVRGFYVSRMGWEVGGEWWGVHKDILQDSLWRSWRSHQGGLVAALSTLGGILAVLLLPPRGIHRCGLSFDLASLSRLTIRSPLIDELPRP